LNSKSRICGEKLAGEDSVDSESYLFSLLEAEFIENILKLTVGNFSTRILFIKLCETIYCFKSKELKSIFEEKFMTLFLKFATGIRLFNILLLHFSFSTGIRLFNILLLHFIFIVFVEERTQI
jgi:hypothetical protein